MKQVKLRTDILGGGREMGFWGVSAQTKMLCRNPPRMCKFQNILVQNVSSLSRRGKRLIPALSSGVLWYILRYPSVQPEIKTKLGSGNQNISTLSKLNALLISQ